MLRELLPLLRLAGPVVTAEIGWMSMGVVDTLMVGPLGPAAIGATGMGSSVFTAIAIFGMGLMLGLDALVSRSFGAARLDETVRWLHQGVWLACLTAPLVMGLAWIVYLTIPRWGLHPDIEVLLTPYFRVISLSAAPLLLYAAFRRYLQGLHVVAPVMAALVSANLVNAAGNWLLIYGNLGFPALGVEGSAWATSIARLYMAVFLFVTIRRLHRARGSAHPQVPYRLDLGRVRQLAALGVPAASQVTLEVGVFSAATALAGRLDPISSAAHQIALNIASLAFMVPLGLASASAVRVGHAVGARDPARAALAGWTAILGGCAVMLLIGVTMLIWPEQMVGAFSTDSRVIDIGATLLFVAALFQVFDGTQAIATGVLRGIGEVRMPMIVNVIGHWVLGLPVAWLLCFTWMWGVIGLWIGLSVGLVFAALSLTLVWFRRSRDPRRLLEHPNVMPVEL